MDDVRSADVCAIRWRFMLCALQKWILSQANETLRCNLLHNGPACLLSFYLGVSEKLYPMLSYVNRSL